MSDRERHHDCSRKFSLPCLIGNVIIITAMGLSIQFLNFSFRSNSPLRLASLPAHACNFHRWSKKAMIRVSHMPPINKLKKKIIISDQKNVTKYIKKNINNLIKNCNPKYYYLLRCRWLPVRTLLFKSLKRCKSGMSSKVCNLPGLIRNVIVIAATIVSLHSALSGPLRKDADRSALGAL